MRDSSNARHRPHRYRTAQRGFTLIEVLAALIIVSLGMLGVIEAVSDTAKNGAYLREKTIAHWVAMNQLSRVRLETRPPKVDKSSDEVEMAGRKWRWSMEVTQTQVQSLVRIDVSVAPAEAPKTTSLATVTGFYGTAIAPAQQPVSWAGADQGGPGGGPGGAPGGGPGRPNTPPPPVNPPSGETSSPPGTER
jgi:general secretion pathway protein I